MKFLIKNEFKNKYNKIKMESKTNYVQNLFLSFFKQNKKEQIDTDTPKEINAVILIQRWWRENQWKIFYTILNEHIDTDVISNISDNEQYYLIKKNFDDVDIDEADDELENQCTSDTSDDKSDYEDEELESLINIYENHHNNFIYDFFTSFFIFIYRGFGF